VGAWCLNSGERQGGPPPPQWQSEQAPPPPPEHEMAGPGPDGRARPLRPEVMKIIMGVLLVGVDLGVYFYVESRRRERRMKELEAENTKQRLESLRYQINPHFFMNTLNNIHALVDIDPDKAKESIEEFSKMMRILLYEGDSPTIPLSKELDFIEHFVSLMRLRYPEESVKIDMVFPDECTGAVVPPLVMASLVENAFKHGVSYSSGSFIRVKVEVGDGKVVFRCSNSSHPSGNDTRHGIGLENIKKRLTLLYGQAFALSIDQTEEQYDVVLAIPSQPDLKVI
ncbi:MAG: histidine kinase, partial [Bacteroidales bacterium]|nr:histidine kinase [Bacteroidales bacterium]